MTPKAFKSLVYSLYNIGLIAHLDTDCANHIIGCVSERRSGPITFREHPFSIAMVPKNVTLRSEWYHVSVPDDGQGSIGAMAESEDEAINLLNNLLKRFGRKHYIE